MKSTMKKFLIIAFIAVIGFSMAACDDKIDKDGNGNVKTENVSLEGTWVGSDGSKMVFNNGKFSVFDGNVELSKGTYKTSGSSITMNTTDVNGALFELLFEDFDEMGLSATKWYTIEETKTILIKYMVDELEMEEEMIDMFLDLMLEGSFGEVTQTYSITGNKMTLTMLGETTTYTKQ